MTVSERIGEIQTLSGTEVVLVKDYSPAGIGMGDPDAVQEHRFLFVRPVEWYLGLEDGMGSLKVTFTDGIRWIGLELRHAMHALMENNPAVIGMLSSRTVFEREEGLSERLLGFVRKAYCRRTYCAYCQEKAMAYTYANMGPKADCMESAMTRLYYHLCSMWAVEREDLPPMGIADMADVLLKEPQERELFRELTELRAASWEHFRMYDPEEVIRLCKNLNTRVIPGMLGLRRVERDCLSELSSFCVQTIMGGFRDSEEAEEEAPVIEEDVPPEIPEEVTREEKKEGILSSFGKRLRRVTMKIGSGVDDLYDQSEGSEA